MAVNNSEITHKLYLLVEGELDRLILQNIFLESEYK